MRRTLGVLGAITLAGCCRLSRHDDCVVIHGRPGGESVGFLIDAVRDGIPVEDEIHRLGASETGVGALTAAPSSNQLLCFCRHRMPAYLRTPVGTPGHRKLWTEGKDQAHVYLREEATVSIELWVVLAGSEAWDHAQALVERTNDILASERAGVILKASRANVSAWQRAGEFATWETSTDHSAVKEMDSGIVDSATGQRAFTPGKVNVYLVDTVDGNPRAGHTDIIDCETIAIGIHSQDHLLAHEFGHACSLPDSSEYEAEVRVLFGKRNVMWTPSTSRGALTEGQIFAAHFCDKSALTRHYELRDGTEEDPVLEWVSYLEGPAEAQVPISLRIWLDSPFSHEAVDRPVFATGPQPEGPLPDPELARAWAGMDCAVDPAQRALRAEILLRGARVEGQLSLLLDGPGQATLDEVTEGARIAYAALPAARRGRSVADFVSRERDRYLVGWQAAVLSALADVGTKASLDAISRISGDPLSPNRERAALAIRSILDHAAQAK